MQAGRTERGRYTSSDSLRQRLDEHGFVRRGAPRGTRVVNEQAPLSICTVVELLSLSLYLYGELIN